MTDDSYLTEKVAGIYEWIDTEIRKNKALTGRCARCGRCCNFETFNHRLFVTTPELIFLRERIGGKNLKKMESCICPYNEDGRCTIHPFRFSGCRIFFCKGDADFQSGLSESAIGRLKLICKEFDCHYLYSELKTALNTFKKF